MTKPKILLISLASLAVTVAVAAVILDKSGYLVRALKPEVVRALSVATGRPVQVESMDGGIFGSISIRNLSLGRAAAQSRKTDISIRVDKAVVTFSLWDFFVRHKEAAESLRRLEFQDPVILLDVAKGGEPDSLGSTRAAEDLSVLLASFPLPPVETLVEGGRLELAMDSGQPKALLEKIQAVLAFHKLQGRAHLELSAASCGGVLKGQADFFPATRAGSGELIISGVDLEKLGVLPGLDALKQLGSASGQIQGRLKLKLVPAAREQWAQGLSVSGVLGLKFNQGSSLEVSLKERQASVTLHKGLGRMEAEGWLRDVSGTTALDFKGLFLHFPISDNGEMEGNFSVGGSLQSPVAQANLNLPQLKFGGETLNQMQAELNLNSHQVALRGSFSWRNFKNLSVSAQASFTDKKLELYNFLAVDALRKRVLAKGFASAAFSGNQALQGSFELGPVESVDLEQAYSVPERINGPVSAHLDLRGSLSDPDLLFKLAGPDVRTAQGQAFGVNAEFQVKAGALILKRAEARDGELSATGRWNTLEDSRIEVTLKKAQLPMLMALGTPGNSKHYTGSLDGRLSLLWGGRYEADITASDLDLGGFAASRASLKGYLASHSWAIEKLAATQAEGGEIHGAALFDPQGRSEAVGSVSFKDWRVSKFGPYSAKLNISAAKSGSLGTWFRRATGIKSAQREIGGDFTLSDFSVVSSPLPALNGHWNWFERGELELQDLNWGPGVAAQANYKIDGTWSARVLLKDAELMPFALLLNLDKEAARQRISAQIEGKGSDAGTQVSFKMAPQLNAEFSKSGAHWQGSASAKSLELRKALELAALAGGEGLVAAGRALSGALSADLSFDSAVPLSLSFSASVENFGMAHSDPLGKLNLAGRASAQELHLDTLDLGVSKSRLQLRNTDLRKVEAGGWEINTEYEARDFPDKAFFRFGGQGNLRAKVSKDSVQADLDWRELLLNRQVFGVGAAKVLWKDRKLKVEDASKTPRYQAILNIPQKGDADLESMSAQLANNGLLEAHHSLDEEGKQRLEISGQAVDVALIAGVLDWNLKLGGLAYGNAVLRLADDSKGHMRLLVSAKVENGNLEGFPFDLATGSVRLEQGRLDLKPLGEPVRIVRRNCYEAEVDGTVPLDTNSAGKDPEQINMNGRLLSGNLGLFDFIDIVDSGTGTVTASVQVRGTARYPEFNGKFEARGGSLKFKRLLAPATDIQATISVDTNKLDIFRLDAQMGSVGQRLYVERGPASEAALTFDQWILSGLNIKLSSGKAGIRFVSNDQYEFISGDLAPFLVLGGTWGDPTLQGKISLSNAVITYPIINKNPKPSTPKDFSERLLWDVVVNPGNKVVFTNSVSRVEIQSDEKGVLLRGPGSDIALEGRIRPLRGRLTYLTSDFQIDDTKDNHVDFLGAQPPRLALWAGRTVRSAQGFDTPIMVEITGNLGNLQMKFDSPNREMTEAQLASMAGLGVDSTGRDVSPEQVLGNIAGKYLIRRISEKFKKARNFDFSLRAPGLVRAMTGGAAQTGTADTMGNTLASKDIGEIEVGSYLPGSKFYGKAALGLKENAYGERDPTYKYGVEYAVGKGQKVEAVTGNDETKLLYSAQTSMDNYDPRKRREALEQKRLLRRATATPTPTPQATLTPEDAINP